MRPDVAAEVPVARSNSIQIRDLPWPAAWIGETGILQDQNEAMRSVIGNLARGHDFATAILDENASAFWLALRRIAMGGPSATLEIRTKANPTKTYIAALARPHLGPPPRLPAILLQLTEITSLRESIDLLAERESRWNHALVCSVSGVWDQRSTGELYYSDVWRAIRGLKPEDPIPPNTDEWLELVHPQDRERVLHCIERQNAGDPDYMTFEYRERHKDGHYIWIECRGACVERNESGQPARIVGTDTDVTARKDQEEWLEGLSRRLKLALDLSRIGIFETDFSTGTSDWDDGMRRIFEFSGDADIKVGDFWERKLHPDDRERTLTYVAARIKELRPFTDEYRIIAKDGSTRFIRSNSLPYLDQDGALKMIGVNWDVTEDHRLREELERQKALAEARNAELEKTRIDAEYSAMHDHLTGLPNRRFLEARLDSWRKDGDTPRQGIAVLHIDLDRFKQINDTLGHGAGDAMLKHAARVLLDNIGPDGFAARIGGDEFVLLVDYDGSEKNLSLLADRIIGTMRHPVWHKGHECRFGASIGIAYSTDVLADPRQLLQNADIALYNAKNHGRSRHEFYTQSSRTILADARRLSSELLRALEQDEIVPYYQLQYDARTRQIVGAECLARWQHPQHGILGPDRFLPMAEECGVLAQIDRIMLDKSLADLETWRQQGLNLPKISVNVSARRLTDPDLAQGLGSLNIRPGTVSFEILESVFLDRQDATVMTNLETLRELSIDIEIDDFGTGHASIVGLLNLKPSTLKIDRQLVEHLPTSQEQRVLVMSIIQIARSLKIKVTAEGVETEEHARILKRLGCDVLQGFGLSRPLDFAATTALLAKHKKTAAVD
ncbi:EAL domain-containing protein [Rhizobium sp. G187]|uniref:EAL domain-containing protein n=1 Tax=Rhizobium sp. G187 TaxID=3451352 RepID=UPI003EE77F77